MYIYIYIHIYIYTHICIHIYIYSYSHIVSDRAGATWLDLSDFCRYYAESMPACGSSHFSPANDFGSVPSHICHLRDIPGALVHKCSCSLFVLGDGRCWRSRTRSQ